MALIKSIQNTASDWQ